MEVQNTRQFTFETFFLIFVTVGYVLFSSFAIPLGIENTRIFAVPYRVAVALFSVYFIIKGFPRLKSAALPVTSIIIFWALYFFKCWYSFKNDQYELQVLNQVDETYIRILLIAFLPSVALVMMDYAKVNLKTAALWCFRILFFMLLLNAVYGLANMENGRMPHIFSIYYISYGHLGTSLVLISLFFLLFKKDNQWRWLWICGILLGCYIVVEGFARSPFLALVVCTLVLLVIKRKIKYILIFVLLLGLVIAAIYISVKTGNNTLIFAERVYRWLFEGDNSLRTPLFQRAVSIFMEHPLLGGRVLYEDGMYPHNLFLELLMSSGIIGFIFYFAKFIPLFDTGQYFFKNGGNNYHTVFFLLFLQYLTLVMTSYSLTGTPEFIHLSAVVIGLSLNNKK